MLSIEYHSEYTMKLSEIDWEIERVVESSQFPMKTASIALSTKEFTAKLLRRYSMKRAQDEFQNFWQDTRRSLRDKAILASQSGKEDLYVRVADIIKVAGMEKVHRVFSKFSESVEGEFIPWDLLKALAHAELEFQLPHLGFVDLPGAEQYNATEQVLDFSPKEIVNNSPTSKHQDEDPVKKRPDFNYEKLIFEKGLHTGDSFNNVNVSRPITPYGSSDIKIKKASDKDASVLTRISAQVFSKVSDDYHIPPPPGFNDMSYTARYIDKSECFKLIIGGKIAGGALLDIGPNETYIYLTRIFIDNEFQSKGYGKKFLLGIESLFPNARSIGVNTPEVMKDNIKFYQSTGYEIASIDATSTPLVHFKKELKGIQ